MTLDHLIGFGVGTLAGFVAALKVIAPMTATKTDDALLERLEQLEGLVADLHLPHADALPAAPKAPDATPAK